MEKKILEIGKDNIESILRKEEFSEITTKDGTTYHYVYSIQKTDDKVTINYYESLSIPFSEVEMVSIKKVNIGITLCVIIGSIATCVYGLFLIVKSDPNY